MQIEVALAKQEEKILLNRLLELYCYDFSEFTREDLDESGLFGYEVLDRYWTEPERFPFLFRINGQLAGFALVRKGSYFPDLDADYASMPTLVAEFFILRKYRCQGMGAAAAKELFDRFPGRWEVSEVEENLPAQKFWRRVIEDYTGGQYEEVSVDNDRWRGPVQIFYSRSKDFIRDE